MNIAIAGYGVEGEASYHYYNTADNDVTILDANDQPSHSLPEDAKSILGEHAFDHLEQFDMVVRTPSLSPSKLGPAKKIWSATNEFFEKCPASIVGVTGTKGKGTTSSLIALMLEKAGRKVHLLGNIGKPALTELPNISKDDIVVFELSSFQLWDLVKSPHIAVVLMVEPDHLNVHKDFEDYVNAKANIGRYQGTDDMLVYHPTNESSARIASESQAGIKKRYLTPEAAHVQDGVIMIDGQAICPVEQVGLHGEYNLQNICAAVSVCWQLGANIDALSSTVKEFKGLEHRLEFVATKQGIDFYNDSYSSAPTATMGAISAFSQPIILIVGGYDRGIDLQPLAKAIWLSPMVKQVIIIGSIRERLAIVLREVGVTNFIISNSQSMDDVVADATEKSHPGDVVLLSPGCASFDMFKDFSERGREFKRVVGELHE